MPIHITAIVNGLTPWNRALLEKLKVVIYSRNSCAAYETDSLPKYL
jgi:hypothetical protein